MWDFVRKIGIWQVQLWFVALEVTEAKQANKGKLFYPIEITLQLLESDSQNMGLASSDAHCIGLRVGKTVEFYMRQILNWIIYTSSPGYT